MIVNYLRINNFRLLSDVTINLEEIVTLIVGRNNSGKTSLMEIFDKFFSGENAKFIFEDFSIITHDYFKQIKDKWILIENLKKDNHEEEASLEEDSLNKITPIIFLEIIITYDDKDSLSLLSPFILDLDPEINTAKIRFEYSPKDYRNFYNIIVKEEDPIKYLHENISKYYTFKIYAISQTDGNLQLIENKKTFLDLFLVNFIFAQRHLDDLSSKTSNRLSRCVENYYNKYYKSNELSPNIIEFIDYTNNEWDKKYEEIFDVLIKDLDFFNYPSSNSHNILIKSKLDPEKLLFGNANVYYEHNSGVFLPESHNGLGYKNLIYIILQLISFHSFYINSIPNPNIHIIFIEEPEVHLHPQMQTLFIRHIRQYIQQKTGWNVQIIITTHSSHIISESIFSQIRYFNQIDDKIVVKNLAELDIDLSDHKFLIQQMTLQKCDIFFADKVILIEGTVERLLLPLMIKKFDKENGTLLNNQYISIIEVGGYYAHKYEKILEFIEVKTLIITDIDCIDNTGKKVPVQNEFFTCNPCLRNWIPKKEKINDLLSLTQTEKIINNICVTYQICESSSNKCGRSFEEAFILANIDVFSNDKTCKNLAYYSIFKNKTKETLKNDSYIIANKIKSKPDFAFDIISIDEWIIPKYISEGLKWLSEGQ